MRTRVDLITMSTRELDRLDVMRGVQEKRLTRVKAGELLRLSARQARRLLQQFDRLGPTASRRRQRSAANAWSKTRREFCLGRQRTHPAGIFRSPRNKVVAVDYRDQERALCRSSLHVGSRWLRSRSLLNSPLK